MFLTDIVEQIVEVFTLYRDAPVDQKDIENLLLLIKNTYHQSTGENYVISKESVLKFFTVMDNLMDDDLRKMFRNVVIDNNLGER